MEQIKNNLRVVTLQKPLALDEDNSPIASSIIDTREIALEDGSPSFDGALIIAAVGAKGADVSAIKIKVEESNDDDFSDASETVADGGAEVTVLENTTTAFEIRRTKRYLRAVVTLTAGGAADTVPVSIVGVLGNWAKPFPLV
jgi:hypothetical protein